MAFYAQSTDLVRLAMDIEDAGWQFYKKLADTSEVKKVKELFIYLASQEAEHKIIFNKIAKDAQNVQENEYVINILAEMETAISDLKMFVFPQKIDPSPHINMTVAIQIALHAEDESIRVYSEMKRVFIDRFSDVLTKVITQEQHHRILLLNLQQTLLSTQ